MDSRERTEADVVKSLSEEERELLKRVLQIERANLHIKEYRPTDDLIDVVKAIFP